MSSVDDLINASGVQQPPKTIAPERQSISTDKGTKTPHTVEVGPENLKNYKPSTKAPDPSHIPEELIDKSAFHYRYVNLRKIDYRRFQGYMPVFHSDVPIHQKTVEGYVRLGDCVLMKVPIKQYEATIRERDEYWNSLYEKKVNQTYNELNRTMSGSAYVVDPETGKEIQ